MAACAVNTPLWALLPASSCALLKRRVRVHLEAIMQAGKRPIWSPACKLSATAACVTHFAACEESQGQALLMAKVLPQPKTPGVVPQLRASASGKHL